MNQRVSTLLKLAACAAVFVAILGLTASGASAQIRAAYTKNVDEPGRAPFQQMVEFNTGAPTCPLPSACLVKFNAVPAGKRLVVESVTALIGNIGGQPAMWAFGDTTGLNSGNLAILDPTFKATGFSVAGVNFFAATSSVRVYFEAGQTPQVKIIGTGGGSFSFVGNTSIHGYLIDAVN